MTGAVRNYIIKNKIEDVVVSSAGIDLGHFSKPFTAHFDELTKIGADASGHKQKLLIQKMIDNETLVVAMDQSQKDYVEKNFNCRCELFSKLAYNTERPIKIDWSKSDEEINNQLREMVHDFFKVAPEIIKNVKAVM